MWRRRLLLLFLSGALLLSSLSSAPAQPAPAQTPAPAAGGEVAKANVQQVSAQSYLFEWALVLVMTGVAMYAVCRSSRRNV